MNPTTHTFLLKSILFFSLFVLQLQAFSQETYYTKGSGTIPFNDVNSWGSTTTGGTPPSLNELSGTTPANFVVQNGANISLPDKSIKIASLALGNSCNVFMNQCTMVVKGSVALEQNAKIDFGTLASSLTIEGDLNGGTGSTIIHKPGSQITQKLILKGANNTLDIFENWFGASDGYSIVSYEGSDQNVFAEEYATLIIAGTGVKTLSKQFFNSTSATVRKRLQLEVKLKLGAIDLVYKGTNDSLVYKNSNNVITGWIWTDGAGMLKNSSTVATQTFPVGDGAAMKALKISGIPVFTDNPDLVLGIRYNATEPNVPLSPNGIGTWIINSTRNFFADKITFINPIDDPAKTILSIPAIALTSSSSSTWNTYTATQPTANVYENVTKKPYIRENNNYAMLFECYTTISPAALPAGFQDAPYQHEYLQLGKDRGTYYPESASSTFNTFEVTVNANGTVLIQGTPTLITTYQVLFTVKDAYGCYTDFTYNIEVKEPVTTWDGTKWNNGPPNEYMNAKFAGNYVTPSKNKTQAKSITVNAGVTLTVVDESILESKSTITNNGTIIQNCSNAQIISADMQIINNPITKPPVKFSSTFTYGLTNQFFSQPITVNIPITGATYSMDPINKIPALSLNPSTGILSGYPSDKGVYNFDIHYKAGNCDYKQAFTLPIIDPVSPNLYINPIASKTFGDADFKISAYSKNTTTPIIYTVSSTSTCAKLKTGTTDILEITCAGPAPSNTITVTASQIAAGLYKEESVTTTFFINKAPAKISIKNTGFLPNAAGALIYEKKSDATPTFTQLTGLDLATVTNDGQVKTFGSTGTFSVSVNIAATNNYTGFDSIYVFAIYTIKQPPVAVNDSIVIEMGQDTTFNIVLNDFGITDPINATLTDIDIENTGMQKKYYSTSLGTFTIDPAGILTITPFDGFIGTEKIGYTVTDEQGLTSQIAYLQITVNEPFKLPDLKGNEIITLNNDGLNDALVIANTNIVSTNNIVITDEAGNIIFKQDNYQNDWKGTDTKGDRMGAGMYFYVFTEKNTGRVLQNSLQIVY